jgi:type IV pilus assembly protein PilV
MRRSSRGYSLIEVMTAVAVMTVGATGLVLMQGATTRGNMQAQESTVAVAVAQTWIERLKRESLAWQTPGTPVTPNLSEPTEVPYLARPTYAGADESPLADHFGFDTTDPNRARFHVRLQNAILHVTPDTDGLNQVDGIRVDLTVYWFRSPANSTDPIVGHLSPSNYVPNTLINDSLLRLPQTRKIYASVVVQPNAGM